MGLKINKCFRAVRFFMEDHINAILKPDELCPPYGGSYPVGDGRFKEAGEEFLRYFIELGRLAPKERVLDIGCGIGRMAAALTRYLDHDGHYEGIDVVQTSVGWCQKRITPRYSNFRFRPINIYNKAYNPKGKIKASEYVFPFQSESFDFVFLTSVFTHMLPTDMENYMREISRVLKANGRCLITFFLFDAASRDRVHPESATLDFKYEMEGYRTTDRQNPEGAVAYSEEYIRGLYEGNRIRLVEPIHYGSWCGREKFLTYQDLIVGIKQ